MIMRFFYSFIIYMALSACSTLIGVGHDCSQNELPDNLQVAIKKSCSGNQLASLQIGQYYEEMAASEDSEEYYKKAASYYSLAAASSSGQTYIYVPGAGKVAGYTMPVTTGPRTYGLAEAKYRLALLYRDGLGVKQNIRKACKLFEAAAVQGQKHEENTKCAS